MIRKLTRKDLLQILKNMSDNNIDSIEIFADSDTDTMYILVTDDIGYVVE